MGIEDTNYMIKLDDILKLERKAVLSGKEFRVCCPNCDDESFHMYINMKCMVYHCFKCETAGSFKGRPVIGSSYQEYGRLLDFSEAAGALSWNVKPKPPEKIVKTLPRTSDFWTIEFEEYMKHTRGLTDHEIIYNQIQESADLTGIYNHCAVFPIYKRGPKYKGVELQYDDVDYFVCRKFPGHDKPAKYINAPWPKGDVLYKPWNPWPNWNGTIVICEGVFDAIRISRVCPAVALLGKRANAEQIEKLKDMPNPLVIWLDPDAETYALKLKILLGKGSLKLGDIFFKGPIKDPGSMNEAEIRESLRYLRLPDAS